MYIWDLASFNLLVRCGNAVCRHATAKKKNLNRALTYLSCSAFSFLQHYVIYEGNGFVSNYNVANTVLNVKL